MTIKYGLNTSASSGLNTMDDNKEDIYFPIIRASIYSFVFTLGIFGNAVVVISTSKFVHLRRPTNLLICNLCTCDLCVLVIGIPLFAFDESKITAEGVCKSTSALLVAFITASVVTLLSIASERYFSIVHNHRKLRLTKKRAFVLILVIDTIALLTSIPQALAMTVEDDKCVNQWATVVEISYTVFLFVLQYIVPLLSMSYLYSRSWQKIRRKNSVTINITNKSPSIHRSNSFYGDLYLQQQQYNTNEEYVSIKDARKIKEECGNNNENEDNVDEMLSASNNHLADITKLRTLRRSNSVTSVTSHLASSFRGSINRLNRSFTNLVTGTEITKNASPFVIKRSRQTVATLKLFLYILTIFAICLLPHHVVQLMHATHVGQLERFEKYWDCLHIFVYINAAVNPWIYAGLNIRYRQAFRRLFNRSHIGHMLKKNLFRTASGNIIFRSQSKKRKNIIKLCYPCLMKNNASSVPENNDIFEDTEFSIDTVDESLKGRTYSKVSKCSRYSEDTDKMTLCLPIIIITNYDEELEQDEQFREFSD